MKLCDCGAERKERKMENQIHGETSGATENAVRQQRMDRRRRRMRVELTALGLQLVGLTVHFAAHNANGACAAYSVSLLLLWCLLATEYEPPIDPSSPTAADKNNLCSKNSGIKSQVSNRPACSAWLGSIGRVPASTPLRVTQDAPASMGRRV